MLTLIIRRLGLLLAASATAIGFLTMPAAQAAPKAELLSYRAEDRAPLNALLWIPAAPTKNITILVPGFYGSMIGGHDYMPMADQMNAKGYAFMTINMRTASNFSDPRLEDAVKDVKAAVELAKQRGFSNIVIMGTSLGGPRSMLYMTEAKDPAVKAYVLLATIESPYEEAQYRMDAAGRARLDAFLVKVREMVAAKQGDQAITYHDWFPGRHVHMTARGFLNVFGSRQDTQISTPLRGSKIDVPTVLFHGTKDEIALKQNPEAIYASLTNAPSRELIWVEGATHYLQPGWIAEEYARRISDWVSKRVPPER